MIKDIQQEILRIKKEKSITILAHSYQAEEIQEIADYTGDSFRLSELAADDPNDTLIMCGVHFMAETCKLLSPDKKVILAKEGCGCPMAEQLSVEERRQLAQMYPDHTVVAYINTTAALKTECDVCVTSSSAVEICKKIENDKILFIPDCNLGAFVAEQLPEKQVKLIKGGCPIH
ncbi:MAG: quinolinate synthase NadA, partial [Oscillospiraceae bacterium]|nr:quinolinate synthase NadA [Oscillospiraceae bacterium]